MTRMMMTLAAVLVALLAASLLTACGGGGGHIATRQSAPPASPDHPSEPAATEDAPSTPSEPEKEPAETADAGAGPGAAGRDITLIGDSPTLCERFPVLPQCQEDAGETPSGEDTVSPPLTGAAQLDRNAGSYQQGGTVTYSRTITAVCVPGPCRFSGTFSGARTAYTYHQWGLWARVGATTLFRADIRRTDDPFSLSGENVRHVEGSRSGSRPARGAATWTGAVRAYDAHPDAYETPVTGDARLSVDFDRSAVSARFTGLSRGHPDLSWDAMRIDAQGTFRQGTDQSITPAIRGAFYGADHQGVAGTFSSARLDGVFGATR